MRKLNLLLTISVLPFIAMPFCTYAQNSILISSGVAQKYFNTYQGSEIFKEIALRRFLEDHQIHNIDDYAQWLKNNMRYQKQSSVSDEWPSSLSTLQHQYGDCKALSVLNSEILKLLGFHPILIGYKTGSQGHVFTVFNRDGQLNILDNTDYYQTNAKNFNEIVVFLYTQYNVETIFEVALDSQKVKPLYTRSMITQILGLKHT